MSRGTVPDSVDRLLGLWEKECPDLDYLAPSVIIRLHRASHGLGTEVARFFERHSLSRGDFEVLASLRRIGRPFSLPQYELMRLEDKTSGTMTFRLNRLAKQGLIEREPDTRDRRVQQVVLTAKGVRLCDRLLPAHLQNEARLLSGMDRRTQRKLANLLRQLLGLLENRRP